MDVSKLTETQRTIRAAIRAFLLIATPDELRKELDISLEQGDAFRVACVAELIRESD